MSPDVSESPKALGRLSDRDFFFISATHAEALARLDYFARQRWNFAMILGSGGSGRSSTLRAFARRLNTREHVIAMVDAAMSSPQQFLFNLAQEWKIDCDPTNDLTTLWAAIEQRLHEHWYNRIQPLAMVDNIDFAPFDVQETVLRLAGLPVALAAEIQFVMTAHEGQLEQINEQIRERIDLRIDLERWNVDEIRDFLEAALPHSGNLEKLFTSDAIHSLQRASGGVSRKVRQLVRLALLAIESQGQRQIDGATVAAVRAELTV